MTLSGPLLLAVTMLSAVAIVVSQEVYIKTCKEQSCLVVQGITYFNKVAECNEFCKFVECKVVGENDKKKTINETSRKDFFQGSVFYCPTVFPWWIILLTVVGVLIVIVAIVVISICICRKAKCCCWRKD